MVGQSPASPSLATLCRDAERITILTGAGISTECGVPDFRSPGSPWLVHKPIAFAEFLADPAVRAEAWRRKFAIDDRHSGAQPGRCHKAVTNLAASGKVAAVITQNIDGLHQAAGLDAARLIELHGNGTFGHCLECRKRFELSFVRQYLERTSQAPVCDCGGFVKSATIAFGQRLREDDILRAVSAAQNCDLFIVAGSSLVVHPAASLPAIAKRSGAVLVIVNREATPLDSAADYLFRGDAGDILETMDDTLRNHTFQNLCDPSRAN